MGTDKITEKKIGELNGRVVMLNKQVQRLMYQLQIEGVGNASYPAAITDMIQDINFCIDKVSLAFNSISDR